MPVNFDLRDFAERYTPAWCSQDAASVAACYSTNGSLTINDGTLSVGRDAITAAAQEFTTDFPDLQVMLDGASATTASSPNRAVISTAPTTSTSSNNIGEPWRHKRPNLWQSPRTIR